MSQIYLQRVAAAGIAFLGVQVFDWARGQRSAVKFEQEHAAAHSLASSSLNLQEWLSARQKVVPGSGPLLSVTNFSLENMEGAKAGSNTGSLL